MSKYKLVEIYKISGQIKLETGLHIGGDEGVIEIGGNDNPIVRDISTGNPYIPGSSLKGKMRVSKKVLKSLKYIFLSLLTM